MKEISYVFSFTFFFTPLIFSLHWWPITLSLPLQNFHVVLPTKKCLLCFLSLALDLCPPFSLWVYRSSFKKTPFTQTPPPLVSWNQDQDGSLHMGDNRNSWVPRVTSWGFRHSKRALWKNRSLWTVHLLRYPEGLKHQFSRRFFFFFFFLAHRTRIRFALICPVIGASSKYCMTIGIVV